MERVTSESPFSLPQHLVIVHHANDMKLSNIRSWKWMKKDMETYFGAYDAHLGCYDILKSQWSRHLAPI